MNLILETSNLQDYLKEQVEVDFSHPLIQAASEELFVNTYSDLEKVKKAFEFVRDEIYHSWDIQGKLVTCAASDVLANKQGICYAKSHLLAAILRSQGIPTGFCYQRLLLFQTPEEGYCVHALNAVYIKSLSKWIRLDARGNKKGINAQFSIEKEKLAFTINEELGEVDYPVIYVHPHPKVLAVLKENKDAITMYKERLPEAL
ncbi:transglutaminase family protein [Niallia sp. FSL R7-0271]|uniref:transglutaminase-like domain-containing protein n=1 Tax=unclassified Niallia TaxID=2837522 RepID=UPI0030F6DAC9